MVRPIPSGATKSRSNRRVSIANENHKTNEVVLDVVVAGVSYWYHMY